MDSDDEEGVNYDLIFATYQFKERGSHVRVVSFWPLASQMCYFNLIFKDYE